MISIGAQVNSQSSSNHECFRTGRMRFTRLLRLEALGARMVIFKARCEAYVSGSLSGRFCETEPIGEGNGLFLEIPLGS